MTVHRNESHKKQVEAWESRRAKNVSSAELPQLYAKAIQAIERRSLSTLSRVTVLVVVDRAIHETKEKFPILVQLKVGSECLEFDDLFDSPNVNLDELKNALRELLIELLNVFGNITADILTRPLHKELMDVTSERPLLVTVPHTLHSINAAKKKTREQK